MCDFVVSFRICMRFLFLYWFLDGMILFLFFVLLLVVFVWSGWYCLISFLFVGVGLGVCWWYSLLWSLLCVGFVVWCYLFCRYLLFWCVGFVYCKLVLVLGCFFFLVEECSWDLYWLGMERFFVECVLSWYIFCFWVIWCLCICMNYWFWYGSFWIVFCGILFLFLWLFCFWCCGKSGLLCCLKIFEFV